jgi:hypothetical protein
MKRSPFLNVGTLAAGVIPDPVKSANATRITQYNPPEGTNILQSAINHFTDRATATFFVVFGGVAIILLIQAGLKYMAAQGDPAAMKTARQSIINILLGIILLTATYRVVMVLLGFATLFS